MTNPGQQASFQASQSAARAAQQNTSTAMNMAATSRRLSAMNSYRKPRGVGVFGLIGRLIWLVFVLAVLVVVVGGFVLVLGR
jgi:hypothetical protein